LALAAVVVFALLAMLLLTTSFFRAKFNYVALDRYYWPIRPLYFTLFLTPLLLIRIPLVRVSMCILAVVGCSWTIRQDWKRTYDRWLAANREATDYGQWAACFTPGAAELYRSLQAAADPGLIIVSNFHEYVALETGLATLPVPPDVPTLERWTTRIATDRGIDNVRVVFLLDSTNRWRDYWIESPERVKQTFGLVAIHDFAGSTDARVFTWRPRPTLLACSSTTN
jgi:hypothetical protein